MVQLASTLALYGSTPIPLALGMAPSIAMKFFEGKAFDDWKRGKENEAKTQAAIVNRLNDVIRSIGGLSKSISRL